MISLETEIQTLYVCFEFFSKIVMQEVTFFDLIKNEKNIEVEFTNNINSEANLIQIVSKISKATPKE